MTNPLLINAPSDGGAPPTGSGGLRIALPISLGTLGTLGAPLATRLTAALPTRDTTLVLAIAAAGAVRNPEKALELAHLIKDKPEEALAPGAPENEVAGIINPILDAVRSARDDPGRQIDVSDVERAAAAAAGANARLVAAAGAQVTDANAEVTLRWALRLVDASVLDRAGRAATRGLALAVIGGDTVGTNDRLTKLEKDVGDVKQDLGDLKTAVVALQKAVDELKAKVDQWGPSPGGGTSPRPGAK